MSRFMEPAQAYLGGANLGTQQFQMLAQLAARAAEMQDQRRRDDFNQANTLRDNERADRSLSFTMGNAAANNARADSYLELAQKRDALEQEQKKNRASVYASFARQSLAGAQGAGPTMGQMAGPGASTIATATVPGAGAMLGMPAPNPEDERWGKMIDFAEAKGDDEALKWIAVQGQTRESRAKANQWFRNVEQMVGDSADFLNKPEERAVYSLYRDMSDPEKASQFILAQAESKRRAAIQANATAAGVAMGVPPAAAAMLSPNQVGELGVRVAQNQMGNTQPRTDPLADNRLTMAGQVYAQQADALEKSKKPEDRARAAEFRAAQMAVAQGHTLPDGSAVLNAGQPGRDGFVRIMAPDGRVSGITPQAFAGIQQSGVEAQQQQKQSGKQALLAAFQQATGRAPRPGSQEDLQILRQIEAQMRGAR